MAGRLAGIARHDRSKGPMEALERITVTQAEGLRGDYRGARAATKPLAQASGFIDRSREPAPRDEGVRCRARMGSSAAATCWSRGCVSLASPGPSVAIGASLVIEVVTECEPCERMDALHEGLFGALVPDWRGGFRGRVIAGGEITVGNEVRIL